MTSTDSDRLSSIWPQLRGASDARARNQLVDQAITAVAALQMDLSRARHAAVLCARLGDAISPAVRDRVASWAREDGHV